MGHIGLIHFDADTFAKFVRERNSAVLKDETSFEFQGEDVPVDFADRIIEYIAEKTNTELRKGYISKN